MKIDRRSLLFGAAGVALAAPERQLYAYTGCYTSEKRKGRGKGINAYRVGANGGWTHVQLVENLVNPSFVATSPDERFLYSAHGDGNVVNAFAIEGGTGKLEAMGRGETGGDNGAHLAVHPGGRYIVVANYGSGTVAVLAVEKDGKPRDQSQLVTLEGALGPNRTEQAASHPHQIVFYNGGGKVAVPDKGLDRIFLFNFDPASGRLAPHGSVATRKGAGPRHIAFHPRLPFAWVVNELGNAVTAYKVTDSLEAIQVISSLPDDFTGDSTGAEILVSRDGRFVYASNRGHDSIARFRVDAKSGRLTAIEWTSTRGKTPRFITFDPEEKFLYAANEQGGNIVPFRVADGRLTMAGNEIKTESATAIAFARM